MGLKIKVVEQSGMTLKRELQRSDTFRDKTCGREECIVYGMSKRLKREL